MIRERTELGAPRDQLLITKWITQRAYYEQGWLAMICHPDVPVMAIQEHEDGIHQLDVMLSHAPGMMRMWGMEEETRGQLRFLQRVLNDIRKGKG